MSEIEHLFDDYERRKRAAKAADAAQESRGNIECATMLLHAVVVPALRQCKEEVGNRAKVELYDAFENSPPRISAMVRVTTNDITSEISYSCDGRPVIRVHKNVCTAKHEFLQSKEELSFDELNARYVKSHFVAFLRLVLEKN